MNESDAKRSSSLSKGVTYSNDMHTDQNEKITLSATIKENDIETTSNKLSKKADATLDDLESRIRQNGLMDSNASIKKIIKLTCWKRILNYFFAPIQTGSRMVYVNGQVEPGNYVKNIVRNQKYNILSF